jgi:hypothetical protein
MDHYRSEIKGVARPLHHALNPNLVQMRPTPRSAARIGRIVVGSKDELMTDRWTEVDEVLSAELPSPFGL